MNQTDRGPREDGAKMRRDFVLRRSSTLTIAGISGGATVVLALFTLFVMYALVTWEEHPEHTGYGIHIELLWTCTPWWLTPACLAFLAAYLCRLSVRKSQEYTYVPPVAEQIAELAAEAILVRGSDAPTAAPTELLRAAQAGTVTAPAELLRPTEYTAI
jgi:hypothetical protein